MAIRAISLFCGAGGFCEGARLAGWRVVSAVESDPQACRTHAANFPELDFPHFSVAKGSRHGPEDVLARDELERLAY
jgi:DNA (cytosine-5)-methyltransferase 1